MTANRPRPEVVMAASVVAAALADYAGTKYAIGSNPGRGAAAVELTSPKDTVQIYPKAERWQGLSIDDLSTYHYDLVSYLRENLTSTCSEIP